MSAQIANAQSDIENHLAALRDAVARGGNGAALAQASDQLTSLSRLQKRIGGSDIASLAAMRSEVTASVAAAQSLVQTVAVQSGSPSSGQAQLYTASAEAERSVRDFEKDFYERRIFDPYLKFASKEDEEAYRHREAERQQAIERARAEHTPQGDLKAVDLSIDQLKDAGAHGADRSPDYDRTMKGLRKSREALSRALPAQDRASSEAARTSAASDEAPATQTAALSPALLAKLRGAGVSVPDQSGTGHGLTQSPPNTSAGIVRT